MASYVELHELSMEERSELHGIVQEMVTVYEQTKMLKERMKDLKQRAKDNLSFDPAAAVKMAQVKFDRHLMETKLKDLEAIIDDADALEVNPA